MGRNPDHSSSARCFGPGTTFGFRALLLCLAGFVAIPTAHASAEGAIDNAPSLALVCEIGDGVLPFAGIQDDRLMVRDGEARIPAPEGARWKVTGPVLENVDRLIPFVPYLVYRRPGQDSRLGLPLAWEAKLQGGWGSGAMARSNRAFLDESIRFAFRSRPPPGAALVFGWWLQGGFQHVHVIPAGGFFREDGAWDHVLFTLSCSEKGGVPVLLYWDAGGLRSNPGVSDRERARLRVILSDDKEALARLLESPSDASGSREERYRLARLAGILGAGACFEALLDERTLRDLERGFADPAGLSFHHIAAATARADFLELCHRIDRGRRMAGLTRVTAPYLPRDLRYVPHPGWSPLHFASWTGDIETVLAILRTFPPGTAKPYLKDAMINAIHRGHVDVADVLWKAGAPVGFGSKQTAERLVQQAALGRTSMVEWLLARGTFATQEVAGSTALHHAARGGDAHLARVLLETGDPDRRNADGLTPLAIAAAAGNEAFARVLLEAGVDPNRVPPEATSALMGAARVNAPGVISLLLDHGADRDARDATGRTALEAALLGGSHQAAKRLVERGARLRPDADQLPELVAAAIVGDFDPLIADLIEKDWRAGEATDDAWHPEAIATAVGSARCRDLLASVADPDRPRPTRHVHALGELDAPVRPQGFARFEDPRDRTEGYPSESVLVDIIIDVDGAVRFPRVKAYSDVRLVSTAVQRAAMVRFTVPTVAGRPVATLTTLRLRFPSSAERPFEITQVDIPPRKISWFAPRFPAPSPSLGKASSVRAMLELDPRGKQRDIMILEAPTRAHADAARRALAQWRFEPARLDFSAVSVRVPVTFPIPAGRSD